jgi:maltokinase
LTRLVTQSALADLLAAWLPAQRWFAGSGTRVRRVEIVSEVGLAAGGAGRAGAPGLRHLMIDAWLGLDKVSYQVLAGIRAELPEELAGANIGALPDGSIAYDGAADPELTAILLHGIAAGRTAGPLRFAAEPGAIIDETAPGRTLPALASNTSVVFGDKAILKLLRRPFSGHHPDLEVPAALARNGSRLVAPPLGWIEMGGDGTGAEGESVVLAILSVYFPGSTDAWSLAIASLNEPEPDFALQARQLGEATGRLHAELADAFGTSVLSRRALADLTDAMQTELTQAMRVVPALRQHEVAVRSRYAALAEPGTEVAIQRIHGDYHLAQVLGTGRAGHAGDDPPGPRRARPRGDDPPATPRRWVVLDFEGEPSVPLARRRAYAPALRDVAGMLRSFDYAAKREALRRPDDRRFADASTAWTRRCQHAFWSGYSQVGGVGRGLPSRVGPLLRALTLQKAVYEAVYEARHRPDWLPIPLAAIAEASQ